MISYANASYYIQATQNPSYESGLYLGDSWNSEISLENKGSCYYTCTLDGTEFELTPGDQKDIDIEIHIENASKSPLYTYKLLQCAVTPGSSPCSETPSFSRSFTFYSYYGFCGDKSKNGDEECDGTSVSSCYSQGYDSGTMKCNADCTFDTSGCNKCGDGKVSGYEKCDEGNDNGNKCSPPYGSSCTYCSKYCTKAYLYGGYCGDGKRDSNEDCESCYQDNPCTDGKNSCYNGKCIDLDSDDNCGIIGNKCTGNTECVNRVCKSKCGNGRIDPGETCRTCTIDAKCSSSEQCSSAGECINVVNDDYNCGAIGNVCDTEEKISDTDIKSCSYDFRKATNVQEVSKEQCKTRTCTTVKTKKNVETDCTLQGTYCQDGTCGCSEGYEVCTPLKRCAKLKELETNQPCGCDFQCQKGFCDLDTKQCVRGLNVQLSSSEKLMEVGEISKVSLSVSNPLNKDVVADIILNIGDGVDVLEVLSGDQCAGSQCKLDKTLIPSGGKRDVTIKIKAKSNVESVMSSSITYSVDGKVEPIEVHDINRITVVECGNGIHETGETFETCCIDSGCPPDEGYYKYSCSKKTNSCSKGLQSYVYLLIIGLLAIVYIIYFISVKSIDYYKKQEKRAKHHHKHSSNSHVSTSKNRHSSKKDNKNTTANSENNDTIGSSKVKKKNNKFDIDLDYDSSKTKTIKSKKHPKFCNKCGGKLKNSKGYCTRCGAKVNPR